MPRSGMQSGDCWARAVAYGLLVLCLARGAYSCEPTYVYGLDWDTTNTNGDWATDSWVLAPGAPPGTPPATQPTGNYTAQVDFTDANGVITIGAGTHRAHGLSMAPYKAASLGILGRVVLSAGAVLDVHRVIGLCGPDLEIGPGHTFENQGTASSLVLSDG